LAVYNWASRLLHRAALGVESVAEATFDIERVIFQKNLTVKKQEHHVFISGLARSGTTLLLQILYSSGCFCSLTYKDMPFLLAPNIWSKCIANSKLVPKKISRVHGDGITISIESPEAFDEIFWRILTGASYVSRDSLKPIDLDESIKEKFAYYISLITKRYGVDRYLSKNNNNILRIATLLEVFPKATVIVPFRHPLDHARSLYKQHMLFTRLHRYDQFTREYMRWLCHYEFGLDHKPISLSGDIPDGRSLEGEAYWVEYWTLIYRDLLEIYGGPSGQVVFVNYDELIVDPNSLLSRLADKLYLPDLLSTEVRKTGEAMKLRNPNKEQIPAEALAVYSGLKKIAL